MVSKGLFKPVGIILVSRTESNSVNALALFTHHFKCLVVLLRICVVERLAQKVQNSKQREREEKMLVVVKMDVSNAFWIGCTKKGKILYIAFHRTKNILLDL